MDRREWLTVLYREANIFLRNNAALIGRITTENLDLEEEIRTPLVKQLGEILTEADNLEDFIKFSVLRDPDPELWRDELSWEGVMTSVSMECLKYDVLGIITKIIDGELPQAPPEQINSFDPHRGIPLRDDTTQRVQQGAPHREDLLDE